MYWVQDCHRCQENYDFPAFITQQQFINEVDESLKQHWTRKKSVEKVRLMITHKFAMPLKDRT